MPKKSSVYIIQDIHRRDDRGILKPVFNFSDALRYGNLKVLIDKRISLVSADSIIEQLSRSLKNFKEHDYIILSGSPTVTALALVILYGMGLRSVRILQWEKKHRAYVPNTLNFEKIYELVDSDEEY